jgi:SAM-dependent methyltransferase
MRTIAEARHGGPNVRFVAALAQATGVGSGAADIVTCAQSLHHMEPEGTLDEVERILRPGGLFAAYDYDWPPVVHPDAERALFAFMRRILALMHDRGLASTQEQWSKADHLPRMHRRGFHYARELLLHNTESCTADRWVDFAVSIRDVAPALHLGLSDAELGLDEFRAATERAFGDRTLPWHVSYRVRVAIK